MSQLTDQQVIDNYNTFTEKLEKNLPVTRWQAFDKMLDEIGERLAVCPASGRLEYHSAWPGGLVDHSLRVLRKGLQLRPALAPEATEEALTVACLFHDFGKLGDHLHDYYLPQESSWHREKLGEMYKINPTIQYMTVPLRGLWMLQYYDISLSQEEYLSIFLNDGQYIDENRPYRLKEPPLAFLVHTADLWATKFEKDLAPKA